MSVTFHSSIIRLFMTTNDNFGPIQAENRITASEISYLYSRFYNVQVSVLCIYLSYDLCLLML